MDGSLKQRELEQIIDTIMDVTCFKFNLDSIKADDYEQPVRQLSNKIKSIIYENYPEQA